MKSPIWSLGGLSYWKGKEYEVISPPYFLGNLFYLQRGPPRFLGVFAEIIQAHPAGFIIAAHLDVLQPSKLSLMGKFCLAVDRLPFHHLLLLLPVALHLLRVTES